MTQQETGQPPLRILVSKPTAQRLDGAIRQVMNGRPFELLLAEPVRGHGHRNVDVAFISRDVTGNSTKHVLVESLEAYYESLRGSPGLRWVHVHSAGADRPIFPELMKRGVAVTVSPGANSEPVAVSVLAGILSLARGFPHYAEAQRRHEWSRASIGKPWRDLEGQRAVVVGWGHIGQRIAQLLRGFGMEIVAVRGSDAPTPDTAATVPFEKLRDVLPHAQWLVLACPLTERTRGLVDAAVLDAMPADACLVNVSRGEVVVQDAMIQALQAGRLAGAYLDVFEHEPLGPDSPLWDMANVILTPHCAGHSSGNAGRVDRIFLDNLGLYLAGRLADKSVGQANKT
jgi:phosphoglycerate dehydrogenase-like enzyme